MTEEVPTSNETNRRGCGAVWKPAVEKACVDFVNEQLQREPFCTVGVVEGKVHALKGRLNAIERDLGADSEKISHLEKLHEAVLSSPPCEGDEILNLLKGFRRQGLRLYGLAEGRDYGDILDEIRKHLRSVVSSEPTNGRQDQAILAVLEGEVEALRRSLQKDSRQAQSDLLNELQRASRNVAEHANISYSARFELFFEAVYVFLTRAYSHVYDLSVKNGLFVRLEREALAGWMNSARILGHACISRSKGILELPALRLPTRQSLAVILVPVIIALFYPAFLFIGTRPPVTTPFHHVASSDLLRPLDSPQTSPIYAVESVATSQSGDHLEEDFWRSLLEE